MGVARQECGPLGKQDSCQVAVSLSAANDHASLPVAYRLYLPEVWAQDMVRRVKAGVSRRACQGGRAKVGVPKEIGFEAKTTIALGQITQALDDSVPVGTVLGDAGYGDETAFRAGVDALGLRYVLGVRPATSVWPPGTAPLPPAPWSGRGRRPPSWMRRSAERQPVSVKALAMNQPARAWRAVTWRQGTQAALSSRVTALRVCPAHRDEKRSKAWSEEWLLVEWPAGEVAPTKYWLSNLPCRTALKRLVHTAKARWRIERAY